ncbi:MAG: ribosomal RNA small subunit methyltransferase A [Bacilli bacterium]|nr:ribosomal RNA small subunit methyltransferase A [Bacilli bacterium]
MPINFQEISNNIKAAQFNKDIGQNFLINESLSSKIVSILNVKKDDIVFEGGSGFGSLSFFLLKKKYKKLVLNDIDNKVILFLKKHFLLNKNTKIIRQSFLNIDISKYTKIISSLPYYITSKSLEYFLINGHNVKKYVFLVQRDVLERLNSGVGTKNYGPLSIIIKNISILRKELIVSKNNFFPKPHIQSAVFSLTTKKNDIFDKKQYFSFLKKIFLHRRKTLYKNLMLYIQNKQKILDILHKLKISILLRPEQVDEKKYLKIFKTINNNDFKSKCKN